MIHLFSFAFIHAGKGRRFHCKSYAVLAVSVDMLSSLPARCPMPHSFEIRRRRRLGVRQLAAAFRSQFFAIQIGNHKGASKLAHSKGFAFDKNYAALGETPSYLDGGLNQPAAKAGALQSKILLGSC
jgi:hypothetical protein